MSQVFRESALERLDAPEELDQLLRTTTSRGWVALGTAVVLVAVVVAWAVVGRLPDRVEGRAVLVAPGSIIPLYTTTGGFVRDVLGAQGDRLVAGQPMLRLGETTSSGVTSVVAAPVEGQITEVMVRRGQLLTPGQQVGVMIRPIEPADQQALMFVGQEVAAQLRPGMLARVAVDAADQEVYGTISGRVESVSTLPYNRAAIEATVQSVVLAERLPIAANGTPYLVTVALDPADTPSGFAWALGVGPADRVLDGALASVEIVVGERAPASYLIPRH